MQIDATLAEKIVKMEQEGLSYAEIGRRTNLSYYAIMQILGRKKNPQKSDDKKEKVKELAREGISYSEIARRLGVSRQRIWQILGSSGERPANVSAEKCVYPRIRKYMNDNKINMSKLTVMLFGENTTWDYAKVRKALKGENCTKYIIDGILKVTGMTYEEAFFQEGE